MSVLSLIQSHCRLHALNVPNAVIGSADTTVIQLYEALQEVLSMMVRESKYNVTTLEASFTATAAEDQGALTTLATSGYKSAIFETFYDRTNRRSLIGPLNETEWQELKALPSAGLMYKFRIRSDHLLLNPIPATPLPTIAFEYNSSWFTVDATTKAYKGTINSDSDTFVFPETIIKAGLRFFWKQLKGLPYQADETSFYNMLNNYIAQDKVKRRINLAGPEGTGIQPGIMVPTNSWNVH